MMFSALFVNAGNYTITFKGSDASGDSSTALTTENITAQITEGAVYVESFTEATKVYAGGNKGGLKLGSGSAAGSFQMSLSDQGQVKATSINVVVNKYSSDTGDLNVTVGGKKYTISNSNFGTEGGCEFSIAAADQVVISTIKVETTTKRAYVKSITVNYDDGEGGEEPGLTEPTLTFAAPSYDFDCGTTEIFYGPAAETNSDGEITYTVTPNAPAASIDGTVVTITEAGTYTVTATVAQTENYASKTAQYTINAASSLNYPTTTETFAFSETSTYGMTVDGSGYTDVGRSFNLNDIVSLKVGTNCRLYTDYTFRLGKSQSSTISVKDGYVITAISADGGNPTTGTMPAQSVGITNETGSTMKLTSITVTYSATEGGISQTITVSGDMATFCTKNALDFTGIEDVKAYIVTDVDTEEVTITRVNGKVAGNTGLIITGTTADVPVVDYNTAEAINYLKPAFNGFTIPTTAAAVTRYVYGKHAGETESAFHKLVNTNGLVSNGNHSYLEVTSAILAPRLRIVESGTNAIQSVSVDAEDNDAIFNIYGQRVDANYKGFVIKNGKKQLNK